MYDGTQYSGWQIQPHSLSIQQIVQEAVRLIIKEEVHVIGSGRTDAGVHALQQVAHFRSEQQIALDSFLRSMNGILPKDIRLESVSSAPSSFHAQRSAKGKEYHYFIALGPIVSPFERLYSCHMPQRIDVELFIQAANLFVGTHDFTSFANSAHHGAAAKNPVRTIRRLDVIRRPHGLAIHIEGNGFLYKMVRNIVGMLLEVASGKRPIDDIPRVFAAKDRRIASKAAPARGLFLVKVFYDSDSS
jgi:tRNA pseudouridine38-40 synthase